MSSAVLDTEDIQKFASLDVAKIPEFSLNGKKLFGRIVSVYDGDTITVALNVFGNFYKFSVRLAGIDTCEIKSKDESLKKHAIAARNRLVSIVCNTPVEEVAAKKLNARKEICAFFEKQMTIVLLECQEFDKYGRLLAKVFPVCKSNDSIVGGSVTVDSNLVPGASLMLGAGLMLGAEDVSEILVKEKLAYRYGGDTKLTETEMVNNLICR